MHSNLNIKCLWKKLLSFTIALSLALSISLITQKPITVHAEDYVGIVIDALGQSGIGGNSKIRNGISYARTGYLCYLLTADGNTIPGMTAQAFYSPGFNALSGSIWVCNSKKGGYSATSWKAAAPWNLPPFNENKSTNVGLIRQWMAQKTVGGCNGIQFVYDNWGLEIAEKFSTGDYVLVVETILNFQPNIKSNGGISSEGMSRAQLEAMVDQFYVIGVLRRKGIDPTGLSIGKIRKEVIDEMLKNQSSGGYQTVGSPVIGTCSDCIAYV